MRPHVVPQASAIALLLLLIILPSAAFAAVPFPPSALAAVLSNIALGRDAAFGPAVAPALGLDTQSPPSERASSLITQIAHEIEQVTSVFANAASQDKIVATRAAVARFSRETAQEGASRSFRGSGPSLSYMRQLLFVPAAKAGKDPVDRVMGIISRFERSPKTEDNYYEYTDPKDLARSKIMDLPGSGTSWTTQAQPAMIPGEVYALKKCRHIFILGWYCNTQLYQIRDLPGSGSGIKLLLTFLRPLPKNADNPAFAGGKAENVVDGYTAVYVVMASGDLVLVYDLGIQSRPDATSLQSRLDAGQKEEYRELVSLIEKSLQIEKLPF